MAISPITLAGAVFSSPDYHGLAKQTQVVSSLDGGFARLVTQGLETVDAKIARADKLMTAFALGEPIPVHQVTIALEEARIAVELSVQVRERLTEAYRSFMSMQL